MAPAVAGVSRAARGMQEGRLSLDQVGVIARRAGEEFGCALCTGLCNVATVRSAADRSKLEPMTRTRQFSAGTAASITKDASEQFSCWRIKLPHVEAAKFDTALRSHLDALIAEPQA